MGGGGICRKNKQWTHIIIIFAGAPLLLVHYDDGIRRDPVLDFKVRYYILGQSTAKPQYLGKTLLSLRLNSFKS